MVQGLHRPSGRRSSGRRLPSCDSVDLDCVGCHDRVHESRPSACNAADVAAKRPESQREPAVKRFLAKLALLLPIPLLVIGINYQVDPGHRFDGGTYERDMAELMLRGDNVANVTNWNERLLQRYYLQGLDERSERRDVLAFGSSRTLQIDETFFPGRRFYNASVNLATVPDYLAIMEMYRERDLLPSEVILGPDPWTLNGNNGISLWHEFESSYEKARARLRSRSAGSPERMARIGGSAEAELTTADGPGWLTSISTRSLELLSPSYFQASVRLLLDDPKLIPARLSGNPGYFPTDERFSDVAIKASDGSYSYPRAHRYKPVSEVRANALRYTVQEPIYGLTGFQEIDERLKREFELLLRSLQDAGVRIVLFLAPFHPVAYRRLVDSGPLEIISEVEDTYREMAARRGIRVIGSYDPEAIGFTGADFYDALHAKRDPVGKLFAERRPQLAE